MTSSLWPAAGRVARQKGPTCSKFAHFALFAQLLHLPFTLHHCRQLPVSKCFLLWFPPFTFCLLCIDLLTAACHIVIATMGLGLRSFGVHLATSIVMVAHGVADNLQHSIVAPPAPILMGAAAVCAGAAVVKHIRKGRNSGQNKDNSEDKVILGV